LAWKFSPSIRRLGRRLAPGAARRAFGATLAGQLGPFDWPATEAFLGFHGDLWLNAEWKGLSDAYRAATDGHSRWSRDTLDARPIVVPDAVADPELEGLRDVILGEGWASLARTRTSKGGVPFEDEDTASGVQTRRGGDMIGLLGHLPAARHGNLSSFHVSAREAVVVAELEIGLGKSGRRGYGLDELTIVPSRRTRDPELVDL
jgi:hypothetical protein